METLGIAVCGLNLVVSFLNMAFTKPKKKRFVAWVMASTGWFVAVIEMTK